MDNGAQEVIAEIYSDFKERAREVRRYADLILALAETQATALAAGPPGNEAVVQGFAIDRELNKTVRASGYLLLYNLVESTVTNAIDAIHRIIEDNDLEYEDLSDDLKKITLNNFKGMIAKVSSGEIGSEHPIQLAMVKLGHKKEKLFSGNVDCRTIRNISNSYGFPHPNPKGKGRHISEFVLEIKNRRNALAHGTLSFEQCGREASPEHLAKVTNETITYLRAVLWSISIYLRNQNYRKPELAN